MTESRNLYVQLTEEELRAFSDELARLTTAHFELESEKKSVMNGFKDKIDKIVLDTRVLARKVSTRRELRDVGCEWTKDFERGIAELYRKDSGEKIDQRKLTEEELQQRLPLPGEIEPAENKVPEA